MNNVLLLSCRSPFLDDDKVYPPLANLYLHESIKKNASDVAVTISDDYSLTDFSWVDEYDGVGISIMTPQREIAQQLLVGIKERKDIPVFAGGPHVKHYLDELLLEPWDHLVPNDGERVIIDIVNGTSQRVLDDYIGKSEFISLGLKPNRLDNKDFLKSYNYSLQGVDSTTMLTARGCPMACTFCEDAKTSSRWTPLDVVKEELDEIVSLGYKGLYIFDDLFAIAMKKVEPICEEIAKRGLVYRCNGQANFFTKWGEDFAKLLSDTGCVEIAFGHESGSQTILDNVIKRTSVQENYLSVEYAQKHGIFVKSFLMIGLPGETRDTISATEDFIKYAQPNDFQLAVYYPYKGTQIRKDMDAGLAVGLQYEGEGLGAYGQKGGSSESVVCSDALSQQELLAERDRLVSTYKPRSHDKFFDIAHKEVLYE